ncbi:MULTISPECIES: protein-L-isoaspartate O-methyltransferase family protein [unclassified Nocardioides]|uniref:protein-L-isoaspartate O-methyltransferase family protein n=1 Tax=unclassified Nocardioides TaxID=2615069 RepID=UPI0006FCC75F|nr:MULTISPECIES: protein-L-isoaspartate O-methyltransferase [unclassified Nocardioides]KQY62609.1 protein-L-isoaspartate carboxylmethyltransferase [Nocardioides sp. Root140]KRF15064.1 protein-L-isoaspartate carboxylmethyltransferase [Nocardioides sp. Soil796]
MEPVAAAFEAVPRAGFLPARARRRASYDGPIPIGEGQTNSQPRTVEAMLELLDVRRGQHVLDVGAGSGWTTALLAHLTGPTGRVRGVELVPSITAWGQRNLEGAAKPWASIEPAEPGVLGLPRHAPYDCILVSAEPATLPDELVAQLADGGRMVIPVSGVMLLVVKRSDDVDVTRHGYYRFVPLK